MSVDPSRDNELPARLMHLLSRQAIKAEGNFGDPTVGSGAHICGSLASSVDHHSTSYQHDRILLVRETGSACRPGRSNG
jgi:hypothetical protein